MDSPSKEDIEGCAVISCAEVTAEEIICHILGVDKLAKPSITEEGVNGYLWAINTKYYTAQAYLYEVKNKALFSPALADRIRAIVFYFDSKQPSSFETVLSWMPFLKELCSDIQLLVCSNCSEDGNVTALERSKILDWCLKNQFELVELESLNESDDEMEDIFKETKGYARIIQALHAHSWANLVLKDEPGPPSKKFVNKYGLGESDENCTDLPGIDSLSLSEVHSANTDHECSDSKELVAQDGCDSSSSKDPAAEAPAEKTNSSGDVISDEEQWLMNIIQEDDPNGLSFESLFSKFHDMKEKVSDLSGEDRKKYAEEVAIAFWRALGGDEEEIEGLSD